LPPIQRSSTDPRPTFRDHRHGRFDASPVSEEASFLEHRAALEATVLAPTAHGELVLELDSGVLRRPL